MNPEQEASDAVTMGTESRQVFPDPLSVFDHHHIHSHGETDILKEKEHTLSLDFGPENHHRGFQTCWPSDYLIQIYLSTAEQVARAALILQTR